MSASKGQPHRIVERCERFAIIHIGDEKESNKLPVPVENHQVYRNTSNSIDLVHIFCAYQKQCRYSLVPVECGVV